MIDKIRQCIQNEDKKNPLTDDQIAVKLGMKREQVTNLRKKNNIPDSRERRKPYLMQYLGELLEENPNMSELALTDAVKSNGFQVSRFLVRQYAEELLASTGTEEKPGKGAKRSEEKRSEADAKAKPKQSGMDPETITPDDPFYDIIGRGESMKSVIMQAKAAMLYPPKGLHTMIYGEPGVGKSDLAEKMYEFAKQSGTISEKAPFVAFNCADYANNHQLLMAQLFGYVKGAFTGADKDKEGLVERANGGVLFLDEVHRLGPEGQEQLFYLIDKGVFRRLGETSSNRKASVLLLMATTENPDSTLLLTFRRRIPMIIEVPSLHARPLYERFDLIAEFFSKEATRTNNTIEVTSEVVRALLLYDCPGNIGQLWSDIQVSCARGFLNRMINQSDRITITVDDLPQHTRKGLLKISNRGEVESLTRGNLEILPGNPIGKPLYKEDVYTLPSEIYPYIENRYIQLQKQGMTDEVINSYIGVELDSRFKKMIQNINRKSRTLLKSDLANIVGNEIVDLTEKMLKIAEKRLNLNSDALFYSLANHLKTTIDRLKEGKAILNPRTAQIKEEHRDEYETAAIMVSLAEAAMNIKFPESEVGFIAMCILALSDQPEAEDEGRIGVVVISHGHVASGMSEVANRLLGVNHAKSVEMSLDESPENALDRVIDAVISADEGKGVLLLVDMGSLVTFGEIVTQKTGIITRVIARTDTVMVIDAVRRAILPGMDLDQLVSVLEENPKYITRLANKDYGEHAKRPRAILAACITGEGSALKVKELIENLLPGLSEQAEIIPIGAMAGDTKEIIASIRKSKDVIAVVGTINPNVPGLPFIFIESILDGSGIQQLRQLLEYSITSITAEYAGSAEAGEDKTGPGGEPAAKKPATGEATAEKEKTTAGELSAKEAATAEGSVDLGKVFTEDLTIFESEAATKEEVIEELCGRMAFAGAVTADFKENVLAREAMASTGIGHQSAIPHADPRYVKKTAIAFAKLKKAIPWGEHPVRYVFLLALPEGGHDIITQLYRIITSDGFENEMEQVATAEQLLQMVRKSR